MTSRAGFCSRLLVPALLLIVVALLFFKGQGPEEDPWHSADLNAEFTARKADVLNSFDDYLRLEDALFAQLDEQVYAHTATGPEYALVRYSAGSAADPRPRQPDWNRSFELAADSPAGGILLLHGMSDSPYSLRALGETLNRQGFQVLGLRLPGHGTAPSGLTSVSWQDMAAAVRLAMQHLAARLGDKPIHIIGYSTGAPLALDFSLNALQGNTAPEPASLILISPAIGVSPAAALATWKRRLSVIPGLGGLAWLQVQPEFDPYKYNSFATNAGEQVHRLTRSVSSRIAALEASGGDGMPPILVFKSTVDATVSTDAVVDRLFRYLGHRRNELVLFDINRSAVKSTLLVADPGPLTARVMDDGALPFTVRLLANADASGNRVVVHYKPPKSAVVKATETLDLAWPRGIVSLSHVALPFPPDDPLYGRRPPGNDDALFLGEMALQGERGLMKISSDWLLRLRYNPFYAYLERRTLEWVGVNRDSPG